MTPPTSIAVHGATGSQGAPVVALLRSRGYRVRPLARRLGVDLLDRRTLDRAYAGVDTVVLHLPLVFDDQAVVMADNVAEAAKAAAIRHLVINTSTALPPQPTGVPFIDARFWAASAAVPAVTVLQPTMYFENLVGPWLLPMLREGELGYPLPGDIAVPWVANADVAAAVARAVFNNVTGWFVLGGKPVRGDEIATAVSSVVGFDVGWRTISADEYRDRLRPHVGEHAAEGIAAGFRLLGGEPPSQPHGAGSPASALGWSPRDATAWAQQATELTLLRSAVAS